MTYDTLIIGSGPAGISAALYLARAGLNVLCIGSGSGALERAEMIENYYGFPEGVSGPALLLRGQQQAQRLGVKILKQEAVSLDIEDTYTVTTSEGIVHKAKTILLATGKVRTSIKALGFETFRGKGISFCAVCDGFFYKDKKIALIGSGEFAFSEYTDLLHVTDSIVLFSNGNTNVSKKFPATLPVIHDKILEFIGNVEGDGQRLVAIQTEDGIQHSVDGCFVALGTANATDFAAKVGIEVRGTDIVIDSNFMTNMNGIFAAGDCAGGYYQIAKAVSEGAHAAKSIIFALKSSHYSTNS